MESFKADAIMNFVFVYFFLQPKFNYGMTLKAY